MKIVDSRQYIVGSRGIKLFLFVFSLFTVYCLLPTQASAQLTEYALLQPLPGVTIAEGTASSTAASYIPGIFRLTLAIAGVLAVLRLIYAGILKMSSDAYANQSESKKIIEETMWGLALTLGAWMIVATLFNDTDGNLDLSLKLPRQALQANQNGPGGEGGGAVGCQGECPYSYQTYSRNVPVTIKYKDCASCSEANSFGLNIKHDLPAGKKAMVNTDLGNKLKAIKSDSTMPSFQVTETWPPTSNHSNQKQYDGTSVDVSLTNKAPGNIIKFIEKAEALGLKATYEVKTDGEKNSLVNGGVPANKILVISRITGAHFSVE